MKTPSDHPFTITELPDGLRIAIPLRRARNLLACGAACTTMAIVCFTLPSLRLRFSESPPPAVWVCGGYLFGVALALLGGSCLYTYFVGQETILLTNTTLAFQGQGVGSSRPLEFDLTQVRDLRATPPVFLPRGQWRPWSEGTIAFDCGGRTYRFGAYLDEAEAKLIVAAILKRSPGLSQA